jgi:hypothetical protein
MKEALMMEQVYQDKMETSIQVDNIKQVTSTIDITDIKPGHRIFELDIAGGIVQPVELIDSAVLFTNRKKYVEFVTRPGCKYIPALNAQNAYRKLVNREKAKNGRAIA